MEVGSSKESDKHASNDHNDNNRKALTNWIGFRDAPEATRGDKAVVVEECRKTCGHALRWASAKLRNDKEVVLEACQQDGWVLKYASDRLRDDKEVVVNACINNGSAIEFASERLRGDKDVVMAAVASYPNSLKHALGGLNQDPDCLVASGLWDKNYSNPNIVKVEEMTAALAVNTITTKNIVLSTRFALKPESFSKATQFVIRLKKHKYIRHGNFTIYSPNAFEKDTCDPQWTSFEWPCRGTFETCCKQDPSLKSGVPKPQSCWRYSYRYQLGQAKQTKGFMIQLVESDQLYLGFQNRTPQTLGDGQRIEREIALEMGIKIFRVHAPILDRNGEHEVEVVFCSSDIEIVVSKIMDWYNDNCYDMSECILHFDQSLERVNGILAVDSNNDGLSSQVS